MPKKKKKTGANKAPPAPEPTPAPQPEPLPQPTHTANDAGQAAQPPAESTPDPTTAQGLRRPTDGDTQIARSTGATGDTTGEDAAAPIAREGADAAETPPPAEPTPQPEPEPAPAPAPAALVEADLAEAESSDLELSSSDDEATPARGCSGRQLSRQQVRQMVRIQLRIWKRPAQVSDAWIDALFDRFDRDGSGLIDDAEWDRLTERLETTPAPGEEPSHPRASARTPRSGRTSQALERETAPDVEVTPESDAAALFATLNSSCEGGEGRAHSLGKIILGRSSEELQVIKRLYGRKYHRTLVGQINKQLQGEFRNFLVDRLAPRDETRGADASFAMQQAKQIAEAAGSADTEALEQVLVEALGRASASQVGAIKAAYHSAHAEGDTARPQTLLALVKRWLGHSDLGWAVMLLLACSPDDAAPSEPAADAPKTAETSTVAVPTDTTVQESPSSSRLVPQARLAEILSIHHDEQWRTRTELVQTTATLQAALSLCTSELRRSRSKLDEVETAKLNAQYTREETIKFLREKVRAQAELAAVYHNQIAVLKHEKATHEEISARYAQRLREEEACTAQLREDLAEEQRSHADTKTQLTAELAGNAAVKAQVEELAEAVSKHEARATIREDVIRGLFEEVEISRQQYESQLTETQQVKASNKQLSGEVAALRSDLEQRQAELSQQIRNMNLLKAQRFGTGSPGSPFPSPGPTENGATAGETAQEDYVVVSKSNDGDGSSVTPGTKDVPIADFKLEPI